MTYHCFHSGDGLQARDSTGTCYHCGTRRDISLKPYVPVPFSPKVQSIYDALGTDEYGFEQVIDNLFKLLD
ncbi:MAG: hypothetical protein KME46_29805 [Brasilonema angustatum HA4187-MV1]|nr:hypothetical protein [Brasilonema angustatum HA4187-MV1]